MLIILLMWADGLVSLGGYSKHYQRDSAEWLQLNAEVDDQIVTTESLRFCYYLNRDAPSDRSDTCRFFTDPLPNVTYDYLAVYARKGKLPAVWEEYIEQTSLFEVKRFENRRQDVMIIYWYKSPQD